MSVTTLLYGTTYGTGREVLSSANHMVKFHTDMVPLLCGGDTFPTLFANYLCYACYAIYSNTYYMKGAFLLCGWSYDLLKNPKC